MGIIICGLNGTGKSTLGKALAEKLHFYFIDIENMYFPKTIPNYIYASPKYSVLLSSKTAFTRNISKMGC